MTDETTELDLTTVLDGIRAELSGLHTESRNLNEIIDRLHAENERLRQAESRQSVQPALRELIKLADDWRSRSVALVDCPDQAQLCGEIVDDVAMILERQNIEEFHAEPETEFDRREHRAVGTRETASPELVGYIAQARRPGYRNGDRVIRFAEVVVYKGAGPAAD
ncbi:MAG TPA: nucleotide exchange factor GrpE [Pseudonocardiaceae bacterium]